MKEHEDNLHQKKEDSPLYKHWVDVHPSSGSTPTFNYHLAGVHRSALERQLKEALNIAGDTSSYPMNSKTEFGRNSLVLQRPTLEGVEVSSQHEHSPKRKRRKTDKPFQPPGTPRTLKEEKEEKQ